MEYSLAVLEIPEKDPAWYTAFYYLAEHIRTISEGQVNHKEIYSLVGVDGRYVNNANPLIRKRTAGALSRIMHSSRYRDDMQKRHLQSESAFEKAAAVLCAQVREVSGVSDDELSAYLRGQCWPDVRHGLDNERGSWRSDIDLLRVDQEMGTFFSCMDKGTLPGRNAAEAKAPLLLGSFFHMLAFGHLGQVFARHLADEYPTEHLAETEDLVAGEAVAACLIHFTDEDHTVVDGAWIASPDRPMIIGRYTDCDVASPNPRISRRHCCVYRRDGRWFLEDLGSRNGSAVMRNGETIFCSHESDIGNRETFELEFGDVIVLAHGVHYWFGKLQSKAAAAFNRIV